jgi:hypothetical protein
VSPPTAPFRHGRPLKRWRYVGIYGPDLMCCFGTVAIGGVPQTFWAVWDREARILRERTRLRAGGVQLAGGRVRVRDRGVAIDLAFDEREGVPIEVVSPHGSEEIWTRKRAGLRFTGSIVIDGAERAFAGRGMIDDSAGYHARHTAWSWSTGIGVGASGEQLAWNLVDGVHDGPTGSERAIWIDGVPYEPPPVAFDAELREVRSADGALALRCAHEAVRKRDDNLILVRSTYEQPFGTFTGELPGGLRLAEGFGVMERHDAHW